MKRSYFSAIILLLAVPAAAETLDGKVLYRKKMCFACHGQEGQGGAIGPAVKNLGKSKDELNEFLKKGSPKMRPFKGTDEEREAIVDYLMSLK